jgi:uncharacterized protein YkwD
MIKYIIGILFSTFYLVASCQNTDLERLFIERVNEIRDEVGCPPLFLIEEYRMASYNHVDYILKTGDVDHTQKNTKLPHGHNRVEYFSDGKLNSSSEIITYNTYNLINDTVIVDTFINSFLSSKPHRNLLLSYTSRSCVMAIHHSSKKNICVVNFTRGEYGTEYAKYNYSHLDATDEELEFSRNQVDIFEKFYNKYIINKSN